MTRQAPIAQDRRRWPVFLFFSLLLLLAASVAAQDRIVRVARLSLVEGEVSYQRAEDGRGDWYEATANLPLGERDRVLTGEGGRAEIQLTGGNHARLSRQTSLRLMQYDGDALQVALNVGTATFRITSLDREELGLSSSDGGEFYFEVATPAAAVTFMQEGVYRIDVSEDGTTRVIVRRGRAEVYNRAIGVVAVKSGRALVLEGGEADTYRLARAEDLDEWDRWNEERDQIFAHRTDSRGVPSWLPGVIDLVTYGDWDESPDYGWVWFPRGVRDGWAPYHDGCWRWHEPHGWTWVSHEPWGWVPYHYGRWAYYRNRWCWVPRGAGRHWSWSPGLVAWVGQGHRGGRRDAYDWVGWIPLGPGEEAGDDYSSRFERMRNYGAPGGLSGVDGRRFDQSRVVVHGITVPPRTAESGARPQFQPVRREVLRPVQPETPSSTPPAAARSLDNRVIVRRPAERFEVQNPAGARPSSRAPINPSPDRVQDESPAPRPAPRRVETNNDREIRVPRPERPSRSPEPSHDHRPTPIERPAPRIERPAPPRDNPPPRRIDPPKESPAPRRADPPKETVAPRRVDPPKESPPQRYEAPPRRTDNPPSASPERQREGAPRRPISERKPEPNTD